MIIELQRAHTPEDYGREEACAICGERFRSEVVLADVATEHKVAMGVACRICVATMGRYKPEKFPTIEEYEAALSRFGEAGPIWGSIEEASEADSQGEPYRAAMAASRIARA